MHRKLILVGASLLTSALILTSCGNAAESQRSESQSSDQSETSDLSTSSQTDDNQGETTDEQTSETEIQSDESSESSSGGGEALILPPSEAEILFPGFELGDVSAFDHELWDTEQAKGVPEPPADISGTLVIDTYFQFLYKAMTEDAFKGYVNYLRELGFVYEASISQQLRYEATREDLITVAVIMHGSDGSGLIDIHESSDVKRDSLYVMETGLTRDYDAAEMGGVADQGDPITGFTIREGSITYMFVEIIDAETYIEAIKEAGYTIVIDERANEETLIYTAENENGDELAYWGTSGDMGFIRFTLNDFKISR